MVHPVNSVIAAAPFEPAVAQSAETVTSGPGSSGSDSAQTEAYTELAVAQVAEAVTPGPAEDPPAEHTLLPPAGPVAIACHNTRPRYIDRQTKTRRRGADSCKVTLL